MINVVLIDFDDTLCLTEEGCFYMENAIAEEMGHQPMTRDVHKKTWGQPLQEAIIKRVPNIDAKQFMELIEKRLPEYIEKSMLDVVPEENLEILRKLKKSGKKLAIVTSRSLIEVKHLLHENHPLTNLLDAFYHKDNLEYVKPDPRVFEKVFRDFSATPSECIYIGDSVSDAKAAKGAGMHFIAVMESGLRTKEDFAKEHVDFYADKFTDILPYILSH